VSVRHRDLCDGPQHARPHGRLLLRAQVRRQRGKHQQSVVLFFLIFRSLLLFRCAGSRAASTCKCRAAPGNNNTNTISVPFDFLFLIVFRRRGKDERGIVILMVDEKIDTDVAIGMLKAKEPFCFSCCCFV
jgi:hypothetical protein